MSKRLLMALMALFLGWNANAWAQYRTESVAPDRVGRWDLGASVAASFNDGSDDDVFFSGAVSYGVTPYIGLGVEAGWQESDGENSGESVGVVPVLADIHFRLPTVHEAIVPYGILGLGVMNVYADDAPGVTDDSDTSFGWKLGAGVDWFLNSNWILNFEWAYWDTDADLPGSSVRDGLDFWTLGVGLKYVF